MGSYLFVKTADFIENAITTGGGYSTQYLTFEALEDGTFSFTNDIDYSIDNGETWTTLTANTASPTITTGNKILWKGELVATTDGIGKFTSTGQFNAYGNVMSLIYGDEFVGQNEVTMDWCFHNLFHTSNIVNAHNLILPYGKLSLQCFSGMFRNCASLISTPKLPATRLASYCYSNMFRNCPLLTTAPELPATALATYCYFQMFVDCIGLTTAPELPATGMVNSCYKYMFQGCTNLNYIKMMAANITPDGCLTNWVINTSSTGTFIKNKDATWTTKGNSGVPSGWTIITTDY